MVGLALAEGIKARYPEAKICFVSTGNALERRCLEEEGYKLFKTGAEAWRGSVRGMITFFISFLMSFLRCLWCWRELRPDVVFGLGGYASLAPVICAYLWRTPVLLMEQNVVPGKATRFLSPWADLILCHWETSNMWLPYGERLRFTGSPLRESVLSGFSFQDVHHAEGKVANQGLSGKTSRNYSLLVLGGSQGARAINDVVLESLPLLKERLPGLRIVHSTGKEDYMRVREAYGRLGFKDSVFDFIGDMGRAYASADLVLSRSGATTLAEITAWGLPAILIPYPYSAERHQNYNAEEIARRGAAVMVEEKNLTATRLVELLVDIFTDDERLQAMRQASKVMGKPFATEEVIRCMATLLLGQKRGKLCQSLSPQAV